MEKWIGFNVSVECGSPLGVYQGSILAADGSSITLTKAFRNGFPYPEPRLTIKAADIKDLKIIEPRQQDDATTSTIAVTKPSKKQHRSTVSENLQTAGSSTKASASNSQANKNTNGNQYQRSKPIEIQQRHNSNSNFSGESAYPSNKGVGSNNTGITPKGKQQRRRNEAFGTSGDDPSLLQEFDFEKNLALFDKQAIWEQLKHSQKPDLLRQTDAATRSQNTKLRHDENVLSSSPAVYRAIHIPEDKRGSIEYVTDEGVIVPSVTPLVRQELWDSLENVGLHHNVPTLLARAAVDIALRLLGGGRRLDPRNAHQVPTVVILVGSHKEGQAGVTCARILASHGVKTVVHVCGNQPHTALLTHLAQYQLTGQPHRIADKLEQLPTADLIIVALASHTHPHAVQYSQAVEWASKSRAAVMALDPPAGGTEGLVAKLSVLAALPLSYTPDNGQLYLANLAVPSLLLHEMGIGYKSPFGAKNVVPLHVSSRR